MKYVVVILVLLVLAVGCAPAGSAATSKPQTPVADTSKSTPAPTVNNDSALQARITALESQLANCQSMNVRLQKQIDQVAGAGSTMSTKEPVSGDVVVYTMKFDKPALQYPDKYVTWDITGMDCGAFERCTLKSALINNHPTLAMTNITVNDDSIGSSGTDARIEPGQTFSNTKNIPMPKVVDYQVTLRWVWK